MRNNSNNVASLLTQRSSTSSSSTSSSSLLRKETTSLYQVKYLGDTISKRREERSRDRHSASRKRKRKRRKRKKKKLEAIPETIEDVEKSNELLILEKLREAVSNSLSELKHSFLSKRRLGVLSLAMDGLQVENRKLSIECRGTKTSNRIKASQRETRKCLVVIDLLKNTLIEKYVV